MIPFGDLVEIYKRIQFHENLDSGDFLCTNDADVKKINVILEDPDDYGISIKKGNIGIQQNIILDISLPSPKLGFLFKDIKDLITNPNNRCIEPEYYYIITNNFYSKNETENFPNEIKKYKSIISFVDLLRSCSAYFDKTSCELIFLNSSVLKIPIMYTEIDINKISEKLIDSIKHHFADNIHLDQKKEILAISLYSLCDRIDKKSMFSYLLHHINDLKIEYEKSYKIFTSGFSYKKIVDELRSKKIDAVAKIHKTFSDIQNQILAIPVATLIAATQMKEVTNNYQMFINIFILFGCFVFGTLIFFALSNQKHTLALMEEEIDYQLKDLKDKYNIFEGEIQDNLNETKNRINRQKKLFVFIQILLIIGILISILYFCYTLS